MGVTNDMLLSSSLCTLSGPPSGYCSSLSTLGLPETYSPRSDRIPLSSVLLPSDLGKTEMPSLCPDPVPRGRQVERVLQMPR